MGGWGGGGGVGNKMGGEVPISHFGKMGRSLKNDFGGENFEKMQYNFLL